MADKISRLLCSCSSKFVGPWSHAGNWILNPTRTLSSCSTRRIIDSPKPAFPASEFLHQATSDEVAAAVGNHHQSKLLDNSRFLGVRTFENGIAKNLFHPPLTKAQECAWTTIAVNSSLLPGPLLSSLNHLELSNFGQNSITNPVQRLPIGIPINYRINPITYEDKTRSKTGPMEDPLSKNQIVIEDAPDSTQSRVEKRAARLIVIRRIKMNKHKLKKLRKRMKHIWGKMRLRRAIRKERAFLDEKLSQIRAAERFDAKEYVTNIIAKAKEKEIPRRWNGKRMPAWWIKEQIALGKIQI